MSPVIHQPAPTSHLAALGLASPGSTMPMPPPSASDPGILPHLQTVTCTVNLGCKLDLKNITVHTRNAEYNPKRFPAVIMRIRDPRVTALMFRSGKVVCVGGKSEQDAWLATRKFARIIQKIGYPAKFLDFKIANIMGTCDLQFPIRLEGLVLHHSRFCSYEPELFPAVIYRMVKPKVAVLIFITGKVVITGAKTTKDIYEAFDNIYPVLRKFKKQYSINKFD